MILELILILVFDIWCFTSLYKGKGIPGKIHLHCDREKDTEIRFYTIRNTSYWIENNGL